MNPANLATPVRTNYMFCLVGTTSSLVYLKILISSFFIITAIIETRSRALITKIY
jgi:hypothetical protein